MATPDEFQALFDSSFGDIWRFARRRCATTDDADDVTAQVFAIAWRRWSEVPSGDAARPWLFGVARRVLANQRRGWARSDRLRQRLAAFASRVRDGTPTPVPDRIDRLHAALDQLGELDRLVVTLRYWDGLAVDEIAAALGTSPNAVSIRLHRTRRRLEDLMGAKERGAAGQVTVAGARHEGVDR